MDKKDYIKRLVDTKINDYLEVFGAVSIEGPKWCGKTSSGLNQAKSVFYLDDEETKEKALLDLNYILDKEEPELIDEWNKVPKIWDAIRRKCDEKQNKCKYILTCSTKLSTELEKKVYHSGAGRIGRVNMYPMSLYESSDSTGKVSIMDLYDNKEIGGTNNKITIDRLAFLIIRGGWPLNLQIDEDKVRIIPKNYIEAILEKDINDDKKRDKTKMSMLLRSLARNESTIVSNKTLINDMEGDSIESRTTLNDYLDVLNRLHIIENQNAYSENYRSPDRLGKSPKRHFVDPSLTCAILGLTKDRLINDLKTFGFMFEALVERDLKIYMDYLDGDLFHFRDNVSGLEIDAILEFNNGDYGAVEIKLGFEQVEEAKQNLQRFYNNMNKKPKFMAVIVGNTDIIVKDKNTGIYILPITALKP